MSQAARPQFVFVSHASEDKKAIAFILRALIDAGVKIWLDKPHDLFSQEEIDANFQQLDVGDGWRRQIGPAANACMFMLVCWSKNAVRKYHNVIAAEVAVARAQDKLLACRIDDVDFGALPDDLSAEETFDFHMSTLKEAYTDEQRMQRAQVLARNIKLKIHAASTQGMTERRTRSDFTPYLADRHTQEQAARDVIRRAEKGGVHAICVKAPRNECADKFLERLQKHTTADTLASRRPWDQVFVDWPARVEPKAFAAAYESQLASALHAPVGEGLRRRLTEAKAAPLAAISVIGMSEWSRRERANVMAWLAWWSGIEKSAGEAKIVPVLAVLLPPAAPGWKVVPRVREDGVSAEAIWKELGKAQKEARAKRASHVQLDRLDVLSPVRLADADRWLLKVAEREQEQVMNGIKKEVGRMFAAREARKGLTMEDFAERIGPKLHAPNN